MNASAGVQADSSDHAAHRRSGAETMEIPPTSHLPPSDERLVGLVTLQLLDTWRVWVKRRVESVSFPDVATQTRHISVDFELPAAVLDPVIRARASPAANDASGLAHDAAAAAQIDERAGEPRVEDVWALGASTGYVLVPLTVLKKQGLTRFSLRDETQMALPLLTRDQTGAVATAVLVTFAEGLRNMSSGTGDLSRELRDDLAGIATFPPDEAREVWQTLHQSKGDESSVYSAWRQTLVDSPRFMALARDLAENFLLLTRIAVEPGRRRIIKISYEHYVSTPRSTDTSLSGRLRRVRRWIGWGAHIEQIEIPAVALGRCFHLEVEAPDGIQATRARLKVEPRSSDSEEHLPPYPDFPEAVSNGKQRVHLHVSAPSSYTGTATVYLRPRPSTIVRSAAITATLTTCLLAFVALRPTSFQTNLGAAAALLLLVPGGLSGYVARPREPEVATQLILGLRFLALSCGLWAFLAAGTLVLGRTCPASTAPGTVCKHWDGTGSVVGIWAAFALVTLCVLAWTLRNTSRPPEQDFT